MSRKFLTRDADGNWIDPLPTRIQQARKVERARIFQQQQLSKITKKLAEQKSKCPHEICYEVPGITSTSHLCIICGTQVD